MAQSPNRPTRSRRIKPTQLPGDSCAELQNPQPPPVERSRLTAEAKAALLQSLQDHQWASAREAYGWLWSAYGSRVSYQTVWRFLNAKGFFVGDKLHSRKLKQGT